MGCTERERGVDMPRRAAAGKYEGGAPSDS